MPFALTKLHLSSIPSGAPCVGGGSELLGQLGSEGEEGYLDKHDGRAVLFTGRVAVGTHGLAVSRELQSKLL